MIFLGIHPRPNDCAESLTVEIIHICQVQHDTFIFSDERSDRGLRPRMDEESAISRASYACFQTTVDNRIITSNPGCAVASRSRKPLIDLLLGTNQIGHRLHVHRVAGEPKAIDVPPILER